MAAAASIQAKGRRAENRPFRTKGQDGVWQWSPILSPMTSRSPKRPPKAKAGHGPSWPRALLGACAALWPIVSAAAAIANEPSTGTVQIRLSVAPRLELKAIGQGSSAYCVDSNASRPALSLRLVKPAMSQEEAPEGAPFAPPVPAGIKWCGAENEASTALPVPAMNGLVLISPE